MISPSDLSKKQAVLALLLIIATAAFLRFYRLEYQSLWFDEVLTYWSSQGSIADVVSQRVVNTNVPPLYYSVVNLFLRLGTSEATLRLTSVLAGLLSIPLLYWIVRNWLGRTSALISASILAISPFHVWYSQEARPYALLVLLALLSLALLQELMRRPDNLGLKIAFVVSTALTFYCHTVALAFVGFLALHVLIHTDQPRWKQWAPTFGAIALLMAPAFYRLVTMPPTSASDATRSFDPVSIAYSPWTFATGYSLGPTVAELHMPDRMTPVFAQMPVILPVMILVSIVFCVGALHLWKRERRYFWSVAAFLILPVIFAVVGSIATVHPFNVRYTMLSFPPFIICIALGLQYCRFKPLLVTAFVGLSFFALGNYYFNERYHREDTRKAAVFLASHAAETDLVLCNARYTKRTLKFYTRSNASMQILGFPSDERYDDIASSLESILGERQHFWLFLSRTFHGDQDGAIRTYCDNHFRRDLELTGAGVEPLLYRR